MEASQSNPPTYPFLPLYYLMLGQLVALTFLFVSKQKGWGLFWRPFLTTLSIVAIGIMLGSPHGSSNSNDSILMLLFVPYSVLLATRFGRSNINRGFHGCYFGLVRLRYQVLEVKQTQLSVRWRTIDWKLRGHQWSEICSLSLRASDHHNLEYFYYIWIVDKANQFSRHRRHLAIHQSVLECYAVGVIVIIESYAGIRRCLPVYEWDWVK